VVPLPCLPPTHVAPPAPPQVTFQLHETFQQPHRTITVPPFEVAEAGWGEFEIIVHVSGRMQFGCSLASHDKSQGVGGETTTVAADMASITDGFVNPCCCIAAQFVSQSCTCCSSAVFLSCCCLVVHASRLHQQPLSVLM
jgi:hypothetical protein